VLLDEDQRSAILASIDDSVGVDGREDEGEAGELLREIRRQRKQLVGAEQRAAQSGDDLVLEPDAWGWDELVERSSDYLSRFGKDLEPMAVLVEASARSIGPENLAETMAMLAAMVETYWDAGLYPAEDEEDGLAARFQPLSGLSGGGSDKEGALISPLRRMTILQAGGGALRYIDKVVADASMTAAQTLSDEQKAERIERAETIYREIEQIARSVAQPALDQALAAVKAAEQSWRQAIGFISERTKPLFPSASLLTQELSNIGGWLEALRPLAVPGAAPAEEVAEESPVAVAEGTGQASAPAAGGAFNIGRVTRREDALRAIAAAADYFLANEPLSPIGATLREVDRRARMSLNALLSELIPDDSAREVFYWRSGIKPPTGQSGQEQAEYQSSEE
jgi:type VI secretion system protein ImpA